MSREIFVYAHWEQFDAPMVVGNLRVDQVRGGEHYSFAYDKQWLASPYVQQIDPDLQLYQGEQHCLNNQNFRIFLDSCPDRWGRLLMQRREAALAKQEDRRPKRLQESDYLLGVHDMYRMGALRFKMSPEGDFLDNNKRLAAPPVSSLRELEHAAAQVEQNSEMGDPDYLRWLYMLMAPGSSLGGARPKACVIDEHDCLWIAKFPSRNDNYDLAAWEMLAHQIALKAGLVMAPCRIERFNSPHHTFLTKRFDRMGGRRLHFSSAMTQLGYYDGEEGASYLEIAQFLMSHGGRAKKDLAQLWRRIVFSMAISNTDDHLRNHGFIFTPRGWCLSPAYDLNPVPEALGLHLNVDDIDNRLDFELAISVIDYFQLTESEAQVILSEVVEAVKAWPDVAEELGISRQEQMYMEPAFNVEN
ncbi:MAG: type II toxin-antitoxin system HipA family toxin [Endozoicomonas sp.]